MKYLRAPPAPRSAGRCRAHTRPQALCRCPPRPRSRASPSSRRRREAEGRGEGQGSEMPPPPPLCAAHPAGPRIAAWAATSSPSSPTRRAPSACRPLFRGMGIYSPIGQAATNRRTRTTAVLQGSQGRPRSSRRASPRPARCHPGSPRHQPRPTTAWRCCPFYIYYSMFGFQRVAGSDLGRRGPALARLSGRRHLGAPPRWLGKGYNTKTGLVI